MLKRSPLLSGLAAIALTLPLSTVSIAQDASPDAYQTMVEVGAERIEQTAQNEGDAILEGLKNKRVLPENSHDHMAKMLETSGLPTPTKSAIVLPVSALSIDAVAQNVSRTAIDPESGVALGGYDPVAYFTLGEPTPGNSDISAERSGAIYYFATEEHRTAFLNNGDQYEPAYGGYCTETVASGALTPASPINWTIHGNRLHLTRSAQSTNEFRKHATESVSKADLVWQQVDASMDASEQIRLENISVTP